MSLVIEPMRWWHVDQVHALEAELFPSDAWSVEQFWSELAQPSRAYVVAMDGDEVLGYAGVFCLPPDADIQTVGVAVRAQGRGIARRMLDDLLGGVDAKGATHTLLEVRAGNDAAIALYHRLGFVEISRRPRYYADGVDAIVMRRSRPSGVDVA